MKYLSGHRWSSRTSLSIILVDCTSLSIKLTLNLFRPVSHPLHCQQEISRTRLSWPFWSLSLSAWQTEVVISLVVARFSGFLQHVTTKKFLSREFSLLCVYPSSHGFTFLCCIAIYKFGFSVQGFAPMCSLGRLKLMFSSKKYRCTLGMVWSRSSIKSFVVFSVSSEKKELDDTTSPLLMSVAYLFYKWIFGSE